MAKKTNNNSVSGSSSSSARKVEIIGISLIAIAVLIGFCILSYTPEDDQYLQKVTITDIYKSDASARMIQNWLGPLGAKLSYLLIYISFGYSSIIFSIVLGYIGWHVFRQRSPQEKYQTIALSLWAMILISTFLGWTHSNWNFPQQAYWSGSAGLQLSVILQNITGIASLFILLVFMGINALLFVDRDLQKTIDNIKHKWNGFRERRQDKKIEKEALKQKKKDERKGRIAKKKAELDRINDRKQSEIKSFIKNGKMVSTPITRKEKEQVDIDEIIERSKFEDEKRLEQQRAEESNVDLRPRVDLVKSDENESLQANSGMDEVEVSVFVGEEEEQADDKELDRQNREKAKQAPVIRYQFPTVDLLNTPPNEGNEVDLEEIQENKRIIMEKLSQHRIDILGINAIVGPTVTLYELQPAPDVKISKIESYANDLKMATAAKGLRILAPIPGKSAVGIEVPNTTRETVYIKQVIKTRKFVETDMALPVAFGKTIENEVFMMDLAKMPHLLVAGATGSGKSVGINTIITCLLYKCHPDNLKFVMIDPKKIELSLYRNIQNHFLAMLPDSDEPIITDTSKALETLNSVTKEMDERYDLLKMAMVRDIKAYNKKFKEEGLEAELGHRHLPYIVVIIDELADLMMTAGKQIEEPIARIAQLARAVGIHLVVATQRPSVNVITGTIKANFPARLAYQVASKVDSRTILDVGGADQLVGMGDMLFTNGAGMTRIQNVFVSTEEVERINGFIGSQAGYKEPFYLPIVHDESSSGVPDPLEDIDDMFETAARVVILHQQGSVSLLQRKLKIGYNRAGRIIDQLFNAGVVGPYQGSTARDVLVETDEELQEILDGLNDL
ncbi:MAG: DNA translocase FtsK [Balneola sp.]|nr:DNA translocase FtsK [Balneola sp.]|tara:strand:- start:782 stop:3319 length:2538 start_codon:yes stop_codon:yes gene_type:complete